MSLGVKAEGRGASLCNLLAASCKDVARAGVSSVKHVPHYASQSFLPCPVLEGPQPRCTR